MEKLNTEARVHIVNEFGSLENYPISYSQGSSKVPLLLIANFLREISDTLARIDEKLGGIEMNRRPSP